MSSEITSTTVRHDRSRFAKRFFSGPRNGLQLLVIAAAFHLLCSVGLAIAGRTQLAPTLIDRDGIMDSFAHDSYDYQAGAIQLAELLRSGQFGGWASAAQPIHVKLIAVPFALLGPVFGFGTLSAEPYNLLCYIAVVGLVFALGREVHSRRVGLLAGGVVALWPTFLLHSMQLLKDPLFLVGSLVLILCATSWLTKSYRPTSALGVSALMMLVLLLLILVRSNVVIVILVVCLLSLVLLILRQSLQRRLLIWNMLSVAAVLLTTMAVMSLSSSNRGERLKQFPTQESGQPKIALNTERQVPSLVIRVPSTTKPEPGDSVAVRWQADADKSARHISSMRSRFAAAYPDSGSVLDGNQEFSGVGDLLRYLPRAAAIGLWAPFPNRWISTGRRVGSVGTLLAGVEMMAIYVFQLLAILAVLREPRRLAIWFLLAIATLGVTALALIVPNLGALYRFRYTFWILVVIAAMVWLERHVASWAVRLRTRRVHRQTIHAATAKAAL